MTLLEALIAVAIVSGVMATAIETFRIAMGRSMVAELEIEATTIAESLLARAGEDLPMQAQQNTKDERGTLAWRLDGSQQAGGNKDAKLIRIESHVRIARGDVVVEKELSTLKLKQAQPK